jgi:hypothetical protein
MQYAEGAWVAPFGPNERAGFGWGDGTVSGVVLQGTFRWSNFPRRREDGVWTPNVTGSIRTEDGADIIVSLHGQSVEEVAGDRLRRAILTRVEMLTEGEPYRWLNTSFIVGEGEIDEDTEEIWIDTYVCVNEIAERAPALGHAPPERFRQGE